MSKKLKEDYKNVLYSNLIAKYINQEHKIDLYECVYFSKCNKVM